MPLSKRNRRGVFWLLIFSVLIAYTPRALNGIYSIDEPEISHEVILAAHAELVEAEIQKNEPSFSKERVKYQVPSEKFDPNQYKLEDWMQLGMSKKQAEVVVKFSQRGLKSNDDLQKIFVFPGELFELVKDSTFYPKTSKYKKWEKEDRKVEPVDLNSAGAEMLESIPGIGPFYAGKIVEYRNELGGFIGKQQLLEIWKFDDQKLAEINQYVFVGAVDLKLLNINKATVEELKRHPYIDYSIANSIVKMRSHSSYKLNTDIKRSKLIDEELYNKLKPYLSIQ